MEAFDATEVVHRKLAQVSRTTPHPASRWPVARRAGIGCQMQELTPVQYDLGTQAVDTGPVPKLRSCRCPILLDWIPVPKGLQIPICCFALCEFHKKSIYDVLTILHQI